MPEHRATDCLIQIKNKGGVTLFLNGLHLEELDEELNHHQIQGTKINIRTVELYSEQGNTDLTEPMVADEIDSSAKFVKDTVPQKSDCANVV